MELPEQLYDVLVKSEALGPERFMVFMLRLPVPVLVMVMVWGSDETLALVLLKLREEGATDISGISWMTVFEVRLPELS
jgi:hypothetical protein